MVDGSFAISDPYREHVVASLSADHNTIATTEYVFNPSEIWEGLKNQKDSWLCNGLIRDWASWQKEKGLPFEHFKDVLKVLSPATEELLEPGELTRISINDVRDMPTIRMPFNQDVPVAHASSGIRRIIALAYILVWTWEEHLKAAKLLGEPVVNQITFLIDEIESHLHPSWQRKIINALLSVMEKLSPDVEVQLITTTHSPLIMASVEPFFDSEQDAWFDFNLEQGKENKVTLQKFDFEKQGNAANWLMSEAFDLKSSRPIEYEKLVDEASALLQKESVDNTNVIAMNRKLVESLSPKDEFFIRWRSICQKKGWLT
jgi:predicted ATP-binding protein involved in virulence